MKKDIVSYFFLIVILLLPVMVSCGHNDDDTTPPVTNQNNDEQEEPKNIDSYYVKYEAMDGGQVSYANKTTRRITFKDVKSDSGVTVYGNWEGTYGPFKKGDKVYLYISTTGRYTTNARLSVSKNTEPFTIKAEERESNSIKLEYIIDF